MEKYKIGNLFYDDEMHYHIERLNKKGKYKLIFGNLNAEKAHFYLDNPDLIERKHKQNIIFIIILLSFMIGTLLAIIFS